MHPGNTIQVSGGLNKQRTFVEDVITHCLDKLLPLHRTLWIEVDLKDLKRENVYGYCYPTDHHLYNLEIDKFQKLYDLILTTCHEMVHVKQGVRKELTERHLKQFWKGVEATGWRTEPWETEAFNLQTELAHTYIREKLGHFVKDIKLVEERCMELY